MKEKIEEAVASVFRSCRFIGGEEVDKFEEEFAAFCGSRYSVGVANGTDALIAALHALGIGAGDEVIVPAFTFTATAEAVALSGARPVFVDINEDGDYNIATDRLDTALTKRTAAVIAVHLYGVPADIGELQSFCKKNSLALIEDAAQAHGAFYENRRVGTFGDIGCFSFYPTKNLGACGDAGAVITDDEQLASRIRLYINHGRKNHTDHITVGRNARMDSIQAAVLRVKLPFLDEWIRKRQENFSFLKERLSELKSIKVRTPQQNRSPAWHLFIAECQNRDVLTEHLRSSGVEAGNHYPRSLVELEAYSYLEYRKEDFPAAVFAASRVFSLPVHPFLTEEEEEKVAASVHNFFG